MTRRTWLVSIVVAGAAAASLAGCGPQNQIATTTPDEKASSGATSASTSSATPSVAPEAAAILKQYRAFYEVGVPAAYKNPKQAQAELAPYATGAQLKTSADGIYAQHLAGYEARGTPVLKPVVVKVAAPTAEVHDCQDSSKAGIWKGDQQLRVGAVNSPVKTTMQLVEGSWRVAATSYPEGQPAGYCP